MKRHLYITATLTLWPLLLAVTVNADPTTAPTATQAVLHPFTVVEQDRTTNDAVGDAKYDWGTMSLGGGEPIQHDFTLHNNTDAPVTIEKIQASCGCTSAVTDNQSNGAYKPIGPGKEVKIHVSIDPGFLTPGVLDKQVWIDLPGQSEHAETLHMTGAITVAVSADPASLTFDSIKAGESPGLTFKLTLDKNAYAGKLPEPTASTPDIRVALDGPESSVSDTQVVRTYKVTVSPHAHIGTLQATINVPYPAGRNGAAMIFVNGKVVGDVSASPHAVAFGTVSDGQPTTSRVTLIGVSNDALKGLTVKCKSADVKARILPQTLHAVSTGASQASVTLEVTLTPKSTGSIQSSVSVTTKKGQVLDIPIWAWVS